MSKSQQRSLVPGGVRVCVIIPAYGVNAYIADALDSVWRRRSRTSRWWSSTTAAPAAETAELRAIVSRYDSQVRYLERENGGQAAARNTALLATSAPLVAFLDGDDYWHPTLLEREVALFDDDPSLDLAYCDARLFGEGPVGGRTYMECGDNSVGPVTLEALLARRVNVTMSTIVARREAVLAAGSFDESLRYVEDYDMWLRMAHRGARMAYITEPLAYRRVRGSSLSADTLKMQRAVVHVLEQFERKHELSASARAAWQDAVASARSRAGLAAAKISLSSGRVASAAGGAPSGASARRELEGARGGGGAASGADDGGRDVPRPGAGCSTRGCGARPRGRRAVRCPPPPARRDAAS
jgi:GT2 family glycosyltransferase